MTLCSVTLTVAFCSGWFGGVVGAVLGTFVAGSVTVTAAPVFLLHGLGRPAESRSTGPIKSGLRVFVFFLVVDVETLTSSAVLVVFMLGRAIARSGSGAFLPHCSARLAPHRPVASSRPTEWSNHWQLVRPQGLAFKLKAKACAPRPHPNLCFVRSRLCSRKQTHFCLGPQRRVSGCFCS